MEEKLWALDELESLPLRDGTRFTGLDVQRDVLARLGNPQDSVLAFHVAGTNGKGTVCAILSTVLRETGARVGQFVSPHLHDVCERCLLDGTPVSRGEFNRALKLVFRAADGVELSYFALSYLASCLVFKNEQCDYVVIETGLGGRLDSTNLMYRPNACVITSVDHDHTHILGDTLTEIAREKAGIMREGVPCFLGNVDAEVREVVEREASACGAPLVSPHQQISPRDFSTRFPEASERFFFSRCSQHRKCDTCGGCP